jgi:hypothetical protein
MPTPQPPPPPPPPPIDTREDDREMTANISGREFEQEGKFLVSVLDNNSFVRTDKLLLVQETL